MIFINASLFQLHLVLEQRYAWVLLGELSASCIQEGERQLTSSTATSISVSMISRTNCGEITKRAREIRSLKLSQMSPISFMVSPVTVTQRTAVPSLATQNAHCLSSSQC
jgi:hypothetical protein